MYQWVLQGNEKVLGTEHTSMLQTVNNLGILYNKQGKLAEAEQMYQRALQGYEKALGTDNTSTYIPALNATWGLGALFEREVDLAKARIMYSKALVGYEKVANFPISQSLQGNLCVLVTVTENRALIDVREPVTRFQGETSRLGAKGTLFKSKRNNLLEVWLTVRTCQCGFTFYV